VRVFILGGGWSDFPDANGFTIEDSGALWLWDFDLDARQPRRRLAIFPRGGWLGLSSSEGAVGLDRELDAREFGFQVQRG
jgi:hypothetical protein